MSNKEVNKNPSKLKESYKSCKELGYDCKDCDVYDRCKCKHKIIY